MEIVIVGCGRVGARLASILSAEGGVTIVDWNPAAFDRLADDFSGETVIGNGIDADVLKRVGTGRADLFLSLTEGDNRNIMAAEVAHQLGAEHVIARVYDPERCSTFSHHGIHTISPTVHGADRLYEMVLGGGEEL